MLQSGSGSQKIFIVHGHDDAAKEATARFVEKLDLVPIILHEQPNKSRALVEKFEQESNVAFAIVLLTPDDIGGKKGETPQNLKDRARQNVVFELGFFFAKLGRSKVCALTKGTIEKPSDIDGVTYIRMEDNWKLELAKEFKAANIQFNHAGLFK